MRVLAIETSCDETAVAILECSGDIDGADFSVMGNALYSQAAQHAAYGGVYPNLAKREHQKNLAPLTIRALIEAHLFQRATTTVNCSRVVEESIRDEQFRRDIQKFLETTQKPDIDLISVTNGPGLEPALWTGINFAEALSRAWNIPLLGIDHMEGHIVSALLKQGTRGRVQGVVGHKQQPAIYNLKPVLFPVLALLISGGHTELVLMKDWFEYKALGKTRDDAVGEAFDKVARLLDLAYPGGPRIAALAERSRARGGTDMSFTTPMAQDPTCDFSFSGLKTAVMYKLKKMDKLSETEKENVAEAFENAAKDALVVKTKKALRDEKPNALVVAGGVSANDTIRNAFEKLLKEEFPTVTLSIPDKSLSGDNAIMIGVAGYLRHHAGKAYEGPMAAHGKLTLEG